MQTPPTRYAERDGVAIAYQVVGDGPVDLLLAPGLISHLDLQWAEPRRAAFLTRLASFRGSSSSTSRGPARGDGVLARFDGPARAVAAVEALLAAVEPLGVQLRAGIHTGEVELMGDDVGGMAVHIGARVGGIAAAGEILVSSTVGDLVVGSQLQFTMRPGDRLAVGLAGRAPRMMRLGARVMMRS